MATGKSLLVPVRGLVLLLLGRGLCGHGVLHHAAYCAAVRMMAGVLYHRRPLSAVTSATRGPPTEPAENTGAASHM